MGEFELLAKLRKRLPSPGPRLRVGMGDDAAVSVPGGATATSVDAIVDGVHFRRSQATLPQIGHKALATALSDLAAMGAEPGEAYVTLGIPADLGEEGCMELLDGLLELAATTGTSLVGGDITRSGQLFVAMTVVGHAAAEEELVTRAGARPGDALVLTGEIGGAPAGLLALEYPEAAVVVPVEAAEQLRARQLEPQPRLAAGRALARAGATAMIDLSDGLGGDAAHLAQASEVRLRIDPDAAPLADGVAQIAAVTGNSLWSLALSGGEDYELLATLPAERVEEARAAVEEAEGIGLTRIGEVEPGEGVEIKPRGGGPVEPRGYDQLG
jgi:thiamine-monophosphate kinase